MNFDLKYPGTITNREFVPEDPAGLAAYLATFPENAAVECIIRKQRKEKSNQQNRYYRGVVVPIIGDALGYAPYENDQVHAILQAKFFVYLDDNGMPFVRSTRLEEWTTSEWEEKMEEIKTWAAIELGAYIPDPNAVDISTISQW